MAKFYTNLTGQYVTSLPPGTTHTRDDLPAPGVHYQIHTVYLHEGAPYCLAEITSWPDAVNDPPQSIEFYARTIGMLYELVAKPPWENKC